MARRSWRLVIIRGSARKRRRAKLPRLHPVSRTEIQWIQRDFCYAYRGLVSDAYREFDTLKTTDPILATRLIRQLNRP